MHSSFSPPLGGAHLCQGLVGGGGGGGGAYWVGGGGGSRIDRGGVPWVVLTITQLYFYAMKFKRSCRQTWPLVCSYY